MSHSKYQYSVNDCFYYFYNNCNKGNACTFRHCLAAKSTNQTCDAWRNYDCKSKNCPLRHMESLNSQIKLLCKFEIKQKTGCKKVNCNFLHQYPYKTPNFQNRSIKQTDILNVFGSHSKVNSKEYKSQNDLNKEIENEIQIKEKANTKTKIKRTESLMIQKNLKQHKQQINRKNQSSSDNSSSYLNTNHEELLISQRDKKQYIKSSKNKPLIEKGIKEQQFKARLAEVKEAEQKLLNEILNKEKNLIEIEERMAKMFQESLHQQKQVFEKEKEALIEQTKQTDTLNNKHSICQKSDNDQNYVNELDYPPSYLSLKQESDRLEVDFDRARGGEYQILLIGGTGTGKSTLINTMANYFLGGSLENTKVVIPTKYFKNTEEGYSTHHSESSLDDVTKSQTTKCLTYTFMHPKNSSLKFVFIDSPGLSDTGGTKQDDLNLEQIIITAINAGALSAIIVIANGTESRVTPSMRNTLVRLGNNLPDELIDNNLLLVLTKCSKLSASFSEEAFSKEIAKPREVFYLDNQAFCSDPRTWKLDEDAYEGLVLKWKQSHRTFDNLLKTITEMANTSTDSFKIMKDLRNKLKSEIATICQDIANIQKVQDRLEAAQLAAQKIVDKEIKEISDKKDYFANYTKQETITLTKIVPAEYHSTVCTTHFIKDVICHQHCGLEFRSGSGTNYFNSCACMGAENRCTKCDCGPLSHYHAMVELKTVTETIEKVLEDMKAHNYSADPDYQKFSAESNTFQKTLDNLQINVDKKYFKIHQLCHDLSKICSRFNFVDELHANIENMKLEARMINNVDLRKKSENEIAKLVKLANDLSSKGMNNKCPDTSQNLIQKFFNSFKFF